MQQAGYLAGCLAVQWQAVWQSISWFPVWQCRRQAIWQAVWQCSGRLSGSASLSVPLCCLRPEAAQGDPAGTAWFNAIAADWEKREAEGEKLAAAAMTDAPTVAPPAIALALDWGFSGDWATRALNFNEPDPDMAASLGGQDR